MSLLSYNKASSIAVDPIEKKPLYHFLPGSTTYSIGAIGCNLACKFCQNHHISHSKSKHDLGYTVDANSIVTSAKKENCKSIAFTYNEPIISLEFIEEIAEIAKSEQIKTVAITAGYISEQARSDFFTKMDATNIDLKSFNNNFYKKFCGIELHYILDTIKYVRNLNNIWLELTTLLIEGENDSAKEISDMSKWIVDNIGTSVPIHFSAFHPAYKINYIERTSLQTLERAREIALNSGIKYVYTGNVINAIGSTTFCSKCNSTLIERSFLKTTPINKILKSTCPVCHEVCAGIFE